MHKHSRCIINAKSSTLCIQCTRIHSFTIIICFVLRVCILLIFHDVTFSQNHRSCKPQVLYLYTSWLLWHFTFCLLSFLSPSYLESVSYLSHSVQYLRTTVTLCTLSNPVCFTPRSKSETISVKVLSSQFPLSFLVSHHLHSPFELISSLSRA